MGHRHVEIVLCWNVTLLRTMTHVHTMNLLLTPYMNERIHIVGCDSRICWLQDLVLMGCESMTEVPAWVMGMPGLRVPFEEWRVRVRNEGKETEVVVRVRPDLVDLSAHAGLVELPSARLRAFSLIFFGF